VWAEETATDADARLWHPWLRINRVLRVMLHTRWTAEASPRVKAALMESDRCAGWFD
jgi:hypothetical protein